MSIRFVLEDSPEFYTNLDMIRGRVVISLSRHEPVGAVIVKLEGEAKTALGTPSNNGSDSGLSHPGPSPSGNTVQENHKILYKVSQVFPDESAPPLAQPVLLAPGQHEFPFQFKIPFNNMCSDPKLMASFAGVAGGFGGIRVMDGSKQLLYAHVTKTLPPSFTGFPGIAEIRYYIKATVQRPGLFSQNWRRQMGLKFLPLEPPRPPSTHQEAYARRPFTFRERTSSSAFSTPLTMGAPWKRSSASAALLATRRGGGGSGSNAHDPADDNNHNHSRIILNPSAPPSIEMSARLPHPSIITCNQPLPVRLIAKKLVPSDADVFLIALQIDLIGLTQVRVQNLAYNETSRWVIMSRAGLSIPVSRAGDAVSHETVLPDALWRDVPLPNTVMPTFVTCNLARSYQLEVKLGLSWAAGAGGRSTNNIISGRNKAVPDPGAQEIHLPLHFSSVSVYSGVAPPPQLVEAMRQGRHQRRASRENQQHQQRRRPVPNPPLPARQQAQQQQQQQQPQSSTQQEVRPPPSSSSRPSRVEEPYDPLYPPQMGAPGQAAAAPPYDDAPPSYDEAMAEEMTGPVFPAGAARPAYSGQTNEDGPSTIPEKN